MINGQIKLKIIVGDITDNRTLDKIKEENYDTIINLISIDHNKSKKILN